MGNAAATSRIKATIERHRHLFDLDRDGLGHSLCSAATSGVQRNIAGECSPDGTPWPPLSPRYAADKAFDYPGNPMAVLHGLMANPREIAGEVVVERHKATVVEGVTELAKKEYSWFSEGDADRPPRPSWGFTTSSEAEAKQLLDARFATA